MPPVSWGPVLRSIVTSIEATDIRELEVDAGGLRIRLLRTPAHAALEATPVDSTALEDDGHHILRCPVTGIWYDSPAPGTAAFVQVGDAVDEGSIVGLVETMKVFNEVTSDQAGIVRRIFAARGDLVSEGAPLFAIKAADPESAVPGSPLQ